MAEDATLSQMVNVNNQGRCAITLDPQDRLPGQQPYQGVVPLFGDQGEKLENISEVLEHYMLQSEQLDTVLVLAADGKVAAGLLIQRLPVQGEANLAGSGTSRANEDVSGGVIYNESLEFLGDAILGQAVTVMLYTSYPELSEGDLAKRRASLVSAVALAEVARAIGLGEHVGALMPGWRASSAARSRRSLRTP